MCSNWGYENLHKHFEKRAIDEIKNAGILIGRILFVGGIPMVTNLKKIETGDVVTNQLVNDHKAEEGGNKAFNDAIVLAGEVPDFATRDVLQKILKDEDRHMDGIEELQDQINQMTLQVFLTTQLILLR
jgi:bacterioferritin